jgi:hypothetical protein
MTKLLAEVMRKVSELPEERQDDAAHMLLSMIENDTTRYHLTDEQVREVELAMSEVREGKIASDADMRALWKGFGA